MNTRCERLVLPADDGHRIVVDIWHPERRPTAVVQILHGLGEHIARYERFAAACTARGFAVVAHNHRGHGENCTADDLGHYADENGWAKLIGDALQVQNNSLRQFPETPLVLLGHSMGSYVGQSLVMRHPQQEIQSLVLSATTMPSRLQLRAGQLLARFERFRLGRRHRSAMLNKLGFGDFNKPFAPNRSEFDWLSRDVSEVDKYVADPLCGFPASCQLWIDLTGGLLEISSRAALASVPTNLPVLITGGERDPVGGNKGLGALAEAYRKSGHKRVTLKMYADGRHEMFNETNRDEFTNDVLGWMELTL